MALLLIPLSLGLIVGLLLLAAALEQRSSMVLVRMALRSKTAPEVTEEVVAAELAHVLQAAGLTRPADAA